MVNFDQEPNRVHLRSSFIMNGVCVTWVGWVDLEQLTGKARLVYNEDYAKVGEWGRLSAGVRCSGWLRKSRNNGCYVVA